VTPSGAYDSVVVTSNPASNTSVTFTVKNIGTLIDTYTLTMSCTGSITCVSEDQSSVSLNPGQRAFVGVTFTPGQPGTSGTVSLTADDGGGLNEKTYAPKARATGDRIDGRWFYNSTGYYNIVSIAGPPPVVSLSPYSSGFQAANEGVVYRHALPAIGTMGVQRALAIVYNSAAASPMAVLTVDIPSPGGSPLPTSYELQVQRASDLTYFTLLNNATYVYYAASGNSSTTRMVAAIDLKAHPMATGAYPINIVVTAVYPLGTIASSISSWLLVNDGSGSPYGAGAGIAGLLRLVVPNPAGGYGALLVDGSGASSYFDRACSSCSFISPAGDSRSLQTYNDPTYGALYRLSSLDGSIVDFLSTTGASNGLPLRTLRLAGLKTDVTFAFDATGTSLVSIRDTAGLVDTLMYVGGQLAQVRDRSGRIASVLVSAGQLTRITDPDGLSDSLIYDANARLTRVVDRAGGQWDYAYNALNQQQSVTGPTATDYSGSAVRPSSTTSTMGLVVWQPNIAGTSPTAPKASVRPDTVMRSVSDPLGNVTRAALDRFGLATKIIDALGETTTITRDTLGNATQTQEPNGHTVSNTYSGYLLTYHGDNTTGEALSYTYNNDHKVIEVSGGGARYDYFYYDGSGGPNGTVKLEYVGNTNTPGVWPPTGGDTLAHHYPDAFGRDTAIADGLGHRGHSTYSAPSAGGNLLQSTDALGHATAFQFDAYGLTSTATMANGATYRVAHDVMSRESTITDPRSGTAIHTYSALGLTRTVDALGQTYAFDLNAWGLTVAWHDLAGASRVDSTYYDMNGNARRLLTRRGDTITVTYDALGRILSRSARPDSGFPAETFRYGLNGAWVVAVNANAYDSINFDQAGRATSVSQTINGITYQMSYGYDTHGRLVSRSAPTGGTYETFVYNPLHGQLDTVCALGTCVAYGRDAELNPDSITYNAGLSSPWLQRQYFDSLHMVTHDSFNVAQLNNDFGATWTYDSLGHIVRAVTPTTGSLLPKYFSYDAAGQLTNACTQNGQFCWNEYGSVLAAYSFDASGNRSDHARVSPGNRVWFFNNDSASYDPNGSVVWKKGMGASYPWNSLDTTLLQWNGAGQLTRVEWWTHGMPTHTVDTMLYDALGHRVAKSKNGSRTWFLYDGDRVAMDIDGATNATVAEYAWTGAGDLLGMRTPLFTSVAITTPMNGTVVGLAAAQGGAEIKRYDVLATPWSQQSTDTGTVVRFRMGGQEYDQEIGLYHLGDRYYDPTMGRFLSEDPIGVAGGLNLYVYTSNDPMSGRDPTGLTSDDCQMGLNCPTVLRPMTVSTTLDLGWTDDLDLSVFLASLWEPSSPGVDPTQTPSGDGPTPSPGPQQRARRTPDKRQPTSCSCAYSQSSGVMVCSFAQNEYTVLPGYSGTGAGRNNPDMQQVRNVGPIPRGTYHTATYTGTHLKSTPNSPVLALVPDPGNDMSATDGGDRAGFLIHMDNPRTHDASKGCIVLPRDSDRRQIAAAGSCAVSVGR
jgi:RHS repeat-associated protein